MLLSNILEIDHFKDKDFSYTTQRKKCSSFNTFDLDNVQLYVNLKKINNFKVLWHQGSISTLRDYALRNFV